MDKPKEFWLKKDEPIYFLVNFPYVESIHVIEYSAYEQLQSKVSDLEDKLYHESRKAPEVEYKLGHEIERLQAQLEMCKEVLEFYADGGNPNRDIWLDEELGYFTGKRARKCLQKLEGEK